MTPVSTILYKSHTLPFRMRSKRLKKHGITNAFRGARTGDFWLMATGLFIWRWASRRGKRRRI